MKKLIAVLAAAGLGLTALTPAAAQQAGQDAEPARHGPAVVLPALEVEVTRSAAQEAGDIVEVAASAGSFETLLTAARKAGLVETLKGEGPLTVFAPTDAAFEKLPDGALQGLLADEERLKAVLTYHVVAGAVTSDQVVKLDEAGTVNGAKVRIRADDEGVLVNDARVVQADVRASNGVIHVIDSVLLPPEPSEEPGY